MGEDLLIRGSIWEGFYLSSLSRGATRNSFFQKEVGFFKVYTCFLEVENHQIWPVWGRRGSVWGDIKADWSKICQLSRINTSRGPQIQYKNQFTGKIPKSGIFFLQNFLYSLFSYLTPDQPLWAAPILLDTWCQVLSTWSFVLASS